MEGVTQMKLDLRARRAYTQRMARRRWPLGLIAAILALALFDAGCSGSSSDAHDQPTDTTRDYADEPRPMTSFPLPEKKEPSKAEARRRLQVIIEKCEELSNDPIASDSLDCRRGGLHTQIINEDE